jgi:hypothetical protein
MIIILIISLIEINIYSNKDTYLLGEDILVWWEIVNRGKEVDYIKLKGSALKLLNDCKIWDINGNKVEHMRISDVKGVIIDRDNKIKDNKSASGREIEPGDTIFGVSKSNLFRDMNLIGFFGSLHFGGIATSYIESGEYFYCMFYWTGKDASNKVWSDTLHFFIIEPTGVEKEAFNLYKEFRKYKLNDGNALVQYALNFLEKYPESIYVSSLFRNLSIYLSVISGMKGYEDIKENMYISTVKFVNYLKKNIDKFIIEERKWKGVLICIMYSKLILGVSKEEAKKEINNLITNLKLPIDDDIKEFFGIKN